MLAAPVLMVLWAACLALPAMAIQEAIATRDWSQVRVALFAPMVLFVAAYWKVGMRGRRKSRTALVATRASPER